MEMTVNDIINALKAHSDNYNKAYKLLENSNEPYRNRIFNCGAAIHDLQSIREIAMRYPQVVRRLPKGTLVDYSDNSMYKLFEKQREIYKNELKKLKESIKDGTFTLKNEMNIKVDRLRDASHVIRDNEIWNNVPGAQEERNRALGSVIGTAFKYPLHVVTRILEGGARIIGNIVSIPVHMIAFPFHLITKKTPYDGKVANKFGAKIGDFLSAGARLIDKGIKRM